MWALSGGGCDPPLRQNLELPDAGDSPIVSSSNDGALLLMSVPADGSPLLYRLMSKTDPRVLSRPPRPTAAAVLDRATYATAADRVLRVWTIEPFDLLERQLLCPPYLPRALPANGPCWHTFAISQSLENIHSDRGGRFDFVQDYRPALSLFSPLRNLYGHERVRPEHT